ncbi:hypothetical protein [Leptospira saintgironsiae]|uniref:ATP-binding protein n=1 Tax=Leptospira saintgironsiae TaxID=2023183 RepID=A0A2M9YCC9_9LEPT|nr:hypothetical protein [Leptospira saintgironsiae]PJZ49208.1 hypothetical protein CH362_07645 [Leptospira saintgironsiae]
MEINFSNIRTHNGSKNSGFEELVCQLAHLQRPNNGKLFVRKEGSGGDAGVECYWVIDDNTEIGWQVKYFPDGLNASRWKQIEESFSTALEKHPNLNHYIVCLPIDKADSRKIGKGGKLVVSVEDEWNKRIQEWEDQAKKIGREIKFSFWGKHEITTFLTIDDPLYSGRALYWFNEPFLGSEIFRNIAKRSKDSLGERYSPEFHVDLPIVRSFDGLSLNSSWWELLREKKSALRKIALEVISFLKKESENGNTSLESEKVEILSKLFKLINDEFEAGIKYKDFHKRISEITSSIEKFSKFYTNFYQTAYNAIDWSQKKEISKSSFFKLESEINDLEYFVNQKTNLSRAKSALLHGEAGIGKSHFLCDLSLSRINENLPTIFLLGAQYCGGNPNDFIKESLDLQSYRTSQVLGAIDAAGEASRTRALIVIDAINEGNYRNDWHDRITGFLSDLSEFSNIAILFSCRSTYLDYILPESATENQLPRLEHNGFRGHEHRAAEIFLSQQGISKPSAPILAPEFTNPLFLKTCCRAIKQNGQNSFPKGLNSITSLFDYYVESIEKIVARKKKFNFQEKIVRSTLIEISSKLLPDNLEGLPVQEARKLVNGYDPYQNSGETLFEILLDEGILSEDVSHKKEKWGELIIRFTYERFSDYFIAQQLLDKVVDIELAFSDKGSIYELLKENGYYSFAGIFEALAIIIAEKFNRELEDLLPHDIEVARWQLDETFQNTVLWRSPSSFTERTFEILNNLDYHLSIDPALDILLKLSTEPNHPWNAELLHRNLIDKEIAERDQFWSIHIAYGDSSEEDNDYESIIRTIIEWSFSGEINSAEEERVRLCSVILIWFLTTPNRKIRDRSTKSLVRILAFFPKLVVDLLEKFSSINDTYLSERLYAIAYGVVCNINNEDVIRNISDCTYSLIFKEGETIPHLLLRDYARGILERALSLGILSSEINPEKFRPPYKISSQFQIPTIDDINKIEGDEFSSRIKSSLMGFPGDFGNYTLGCVHSWSSTPLFNSTTENGLTLKKRFANETLTGNLKKEYLRKIESEKRENTPITKDKLLEFISWDDEEYKRIFEVSRKEQEDFDKRVNERLNVEQKEYYLWISGLSDDRPAAFSKKLAQRWICKRAHEFGWSEELFADFERNCSFGRGGGPSGGAMERVGKKYQWMAFHEFLARLSDNYHWINRGYVDITDDDIYEGPWQIFKRDIDPTLWARQSGEYKTFHNEQCTWWQPYKFPFPKENNHASKTNFLWDEDVIPDFSDLLQRRMPSDNSSWLVLHGFWSENKKYIDIESESPELDGWFRINSVLIRKGDYDSLVKGVEEKTLCDPHIVSVHSTQHQGFFGEYPWHPIYRHIYDWIEPEESDSDKIAVKHFIPYSTYEWEAGNHDYSLNHSLQIQLPAKEIIQGMGLTRTLGKLGTWEQKGKLVFIDPSIEEYGPSYALMQTDTLQKWLEENGFEIVWLIGGEKLMFLSGPGRFFGRLIYSGVFKIEDGKPIGKIWCDREEPIK